jgi:hypothetical protein
VDLEHLRLPQAEENYGIEAETDAETAAEAPAAAASATSIRPIGS